MYPKKLDVNTYKYFKELQKQQKYVSIPFKFSDVEENDRQKEIRTIVNKYDFTYVDLDSAESILYELNRNCKPERKMSIPYGGSVNYAIAYNENIVFDIQIEDEYYGGGLIEQGICLNGIAVLNDISNNELTEALEWLDRIFNG